MAGPDNHYCILRKSTSDATTPQRRYRQFLRQPSRPLKPPCCRHRSNLDRRHCSELHQGEPIRHNTWLKDDTMNVAFRQMLHNVTCHHRGLETKKKQWGWSTRYDRHILRHHFRSRRAVAVEFGKIGQCLTAYRGSRH